jgi:hypothetical protein
MNSEMSFGLYSAVGLAEMPQNGARMHTAGSSRALFELIEPTATLPFCVGGLVRGQGLRFSYEPLPSNT